MGSVPTKLVIKKCRGRIVPFLMAGDVSGSRSGVVEYRASVVGTSAISARFKSVLTA